MYFLQDASRMHSKFSLRHLIILGELRVYEPPYSPLVPLCFLDMKRAADQCLQAKAGQEAQFEREYYNIGRFKSQRYLESGQEQRSRSQVGPSGWQGGKKVQNEVKATGLTGAKVWKKNCPDPRR
ncbi:hypothetical protein B0H11DRAFT_1907868 [Mycena galericulata]|nr:hypothetical protein B0H11DRAFT_1907868 [Mycena galericulata]